MSVKRDLLKFLDFIAGSPLIYILSLLPIAGKEHRKLPENTKCLFIRPGGIGDAVALLPAIAFIKANNQKWQIDVLAEKRNADIFRACGSINKIYLYDSLHGLLKCFASGYDIAIDTEQWHRLSAIAALLCAPYRVGFGTNQRKNLFSSAHPYYENEKEADAFIRLVEIFCGTTGDRRGQFIRSPVLVLNSSKYQTVLEKVSRIETEKKVSISIGGSTPEKVWKKERFRMLIKSLLHKRIGVVVVGGREERGISREIRQGLIFSRNLGKAFLDLTGTVTLLETAAAVGKTDLLVSGDTGVLHIGAAMGVSTVSLFGPGNSKKWAPSGDNHIHINQKVPCSPCSEFGYTPKCVKKMACMEAITTGEVEKAVLRLLKR